MWSASCEREMDSITVCHVSVCLYVHVHTFGSRDSRDIYYTCVVYQEFTLL